MKRYIEDFFPNQRYTSKGEPELGIGILTETSKGKVKIYFPRSNEMRLYALESAPIRRVVFKPGDIIIDTKKQSLLIKRVKLEDELYMYYGKDRKACWLSNLWTSGCCATSSDLTGLRIQFLFVGTGVCSLASFTPCFTANEIATC